MPVPRDIKFQHWIIGLASLLVIGLTAVFLGTVLRQFERAAQDSAREKYAVMAERAADNLRAVLQSNATRATAVTQGGAAGLLREGQLDTERALAFLQASVRQYPGVYSEYFGLPNDDFIQAIGVHQDSLITTALQAPADTEVALRVLRGTDSERLEHWQFLNAAGQLVGERRNTSTFIPTSRPWYRAARSSQGAHITAPYVFSSTQRGGLTIAAALPGDAGVYGIDTSLHDLPEFLASLPLSDNAFIAILDSERLVIAASGKGRSSDAATLPALSPIEELKHPWWASLHAQLDQLPAHGTTLAPLADTDMVLTQATLNVGQGASYRVVSWAPVTDFTAPVERARRDVLLISAVLLAVLVPLALLGTRSVTAALTTLAADSERLKKLDFSSNPHDVKSFLYEVNTLGEAQNVMYHSIKDRTEALQVAQAKLAQLVDSGILLAREKNREQLLRHVLFGARDLAHCAAATLFLRTDHDTLRFALRTSDDPLPAFEIPLHNPQTGEPQHQFLATHVALSGESVVVDDVYAETRFDLSGTKQFSEASGFRTVSMLTVPLYPREGQVIAVLQLMNALDPQTGEVVPFDPELVGFVEALASQAAVAIENQRLLEAQKALVDAMIQISAGAIDAKSAYTGGHCERVPELALMLAEEAGQVTAGPLADFRFQNEDEWREFKIGAWLHDCGKVTTPEYVVDKATKLETIFNRIHEIRMRFEVLRRDADIERLQAVHERGEDRTSVEARWAERATQLQDDFAFVAECNLGGEFMAPDKVERLQRIAAQTWQRHFDDRLGLSHEELRRYEQEPAPRLPVAEPLLADKAHHIVPRGDDKALDPKYGFQVKVPQHLYNHGEVYNLSIGRGTLTEEERFKINEHIIQTIVMLDNLPFPEYLRRVPEYAGTHHETLIGTGYPRKLTAAELSVPSRIMAIADIFEALTASDRPYKKAKTLSESIKILWFFKKDRHIDAELFDLFLRSGVYQRYAERFLKPEQIDEVDIAPYLGPVPERT